MARSRQYRPTNHSYQPLDAQPLHEKVVRQITHQIVSGQTEPGSCLPTEAEFAQQFGVSRTVIREAIRILVSKGLVLAKQGSGIWVRPPECWHQLDPLVLFERLRTSRDGSALEEFLELRMVEPEMAALAAARRTEEDLEALERILSEMRNAMAEPEKYAKLDLEFHDRLFMASRNSMLREMVRPIYSVLKLTWAVMVSENVRASAKVMAFPIHEAVLAALRAGDSQAARDEMHRLIQQSQGRTRQMFLERAGGFLEQAPESLMTAQDTP